MRTCLLLIVASFSTNVAECCVQIRSGLRGAFFLRTRGLGFCEDSGWMSRSGHPIFACLPSAGHIFLTLPPAAVEAAHSATWAYVWFSVRRVCSLNMKQTFFSGSAALAAVLVVACVGVAGSASAKDAPDSGTHSGSVSTQLNRHGDSAGQPVDAGGKGAGDKITLAGQGESSRAGQPDRTSLPMAADPTGEQHPYELNTYHIDDEVPWQDRQYGVPLQVGDGFFDANRDNRRFRVVDIWYSTGKYGFFNVGRQVFLEEVTGSLDDPLALSEPNEFGRN
jgi:hypothetical protein